MADLDTPSKRASSVNLFGRTLALPIPDGAITLVDRQHAAATYSGVSASTLPPAGTAGDAGQLIGPNRLAFGV